MVHLKGGKLLLDIDLSEIKQLTDDEYNCIISKGLVLRNTSSPVPYVFDVIFNHFMLDENENIIGLESRIYSEDDLYAIIRLNFEDKTLRFVEI